MELIYFVLFIGALFIIGFTTLNFFKITKNVELDAAILSVPIGLAILIISILLLSPFLGIRQSISLIIMLFSIVFLITCRKSIQGIMKSNLLRSTFKMFRNHRIERKHVIEWFFKISKINLILLTVVIIIVVGLIYRNTSWPVVDWDSLTSYDFIARIWYESNSINSYHVGNIMLDPNLGRPPFTAVMHIFSYLIFGPFHQAKLFYSVLFVFLTLIIYYNLKSSTTRSVALLGTIFVISTPLLTNAQAAYTNFPFSTYFLISLIYFQKWFNDRKTFYLAVGFITFISSVWIRQEFYPFHILTGLVFIIVGVKNKKSVIIGLIIIVGALLQPKIWRLIADYHLANIPSEVYLQFFSEKADRLTYTPPSIFKALSSINVDIVNRFWETIPYALKIFISSVMIYFLAFILSVLGIGKSFFYRNFFLGLLIPSAVVCFFAGVYMFSIIFPEDWYNIAGSASRMLIFLPGVITYYIFSTVNWNEYFERVRNLLKFIRE